MPVEVEAALWALLQFRTNVFTRLTWHASTLSLPRYAEVEKVSARAVLSGGSGCAITSLFNYQEVYKGFDNMDDWGMEGWLAFMDGWMDDMTLPWVSRCWLPRCSKRFSPESLAKSFSVEVVSIGLFDGWQYVS